MALCTFPEANMSKGLSQIADALSLSKALLLLGELKLSEVDAVIPEHLRAVLADAQQAHQDIASAYATLLRLTLDALSARVAGDDPVLEKQLRMVTLPVTVNVVTYGATVTGCGTEVVARVHESRVQQSGVTFVG